MGAIGAVFVFFIYAIAVSGGVVVIVALLRGWRPNSPGKLLLLVGYLPFALVALSIVREIYMTDERNRKTGFISITQEALREYYALYPERFRQKTNDEEADVQGFAIWFQVYLKDRKGNWPEITRQFRFKDGALLDREGYAVRFAVDFDHDYFISAFGQRVAIERVVGAPGEPPPPDRSVTLAMLFPPDTTVRYQRISEK